MYFECLSGSCPQVPTHPSAQLPSVPECPSVLRVPSSARVPKSPSSALAVILESPWRVSGVPLSVQFPIECSLSEKIRRYYKKWTP